MAGILGFGMFSSYFAMFHMDLENVLVFIYLKIISFGLIPITICFGWLYLWRNESNPFMFLSIYNSVTQALFLVINVLRVQINRLGFFGLTHLILSVFLIIIYLTSWAYTKTGFFITGGLILLNVVLAFGLVLTTFECIHPIGLTAFSSFITEIGIMGTLLAASSQLYWHDILKKRREEEIIERIFSELDAEESTPSL
jgi:hypothetical protein